MRLGYVVLYVQDPDACLAFWTERVGMVEKSRQAAGGFSIVKVGFADQDVAFELVPLELMKDNPDGLDLATPSIAFHAQDLAATHAARWSPKVLRQWSRVSTRVWLRSRFPTMRAAGSQSRRAESEFDRASRHRDDSRRCSSCRLTRRRPAHCGPSCNSTSWTPVPGVDRC